MSDMSSTWHNTSGGKPAKTVGMDTDHKKGPCDRTARWKSQPHSFLLGKLSCNVRHPQNVPFEMSNSASLVNLIELLIGGGGDQIVSFT